MMRQHVPSLCAKAIDIGRNDRCNALTAADFDVLVDNENDQIGLFIALHGFDCKAHIHAASKNLAPTMGHRIAALQCWRHGVDTQDVVAGLPNLHHGFEVVIFESLVKRLLGCFRGCKQYGLT